MTASSTVDTVLVATHVRSLLRSLAIGAGLGLLGFGLNQFAVPLGFHVHFLIGSIVLVFGVRSDRTGIAPLVAGIVAGYATVPLWGHPWAWLIFSCEALVVALATRRHFPAIFADAAYWLVAGAPLVVVTYGGIMNLDATSVGLIVAKQGLNGIANIAFATTLIWLVSSAIPRLAARFQPLRMRTLFGNVLAFVLLMPTIFFLWQSFAAQDRGLFASKEHRIQTDAKMVETLIGIELREIARIVRSSTPEQAAQTLARAFGHVTRVLVVEDGQLIELVDRGADGVDRRIQSEDDLDIGALTGSASLPPRVLFPEETSIRFAVACDRSVTAGCSLFITFLPTAVGESLMVIALDLDAIAGELDGVRNGREVIAISDDPGNHLTPTIVEQLGGAGAFSRQPIGAANATALELVLPSSVKGSLMSRWTAGYAVGWASIAPSPGLALVVEIASPLRESVVAYREFQRDVLVGAAVFVGLAVCLVFGMTFLFVQPLERLQRLIAGVVDIDRSLPEPKFSSVAEIAEVEAAIVRAAGALDAQRAEVRRLQARLELLIREAPIAIFAIERRVDRGWHVVFHSPSLLTQTGIDPADFADFLLWAERIHPEDRAEKDRQWRKFMETGESAATFRLLDSAGNYRWLFNELKRVEADSPDASDFAIGVIMDIDARKRDQERIESASRLITLGEMATGMAHELNQPLNVIRMAAQNMMLRAERDQLPDDLRRYLAEKLQRIDAQTRRAANTIEHMRIFGRRPGTEPAAFDVDESVRAALDLTSPQLKAADIVVDHAAAGNLPPVLGHSQLIEQVLINLLVNARDAIVASQASNAAASSRGRIGVVTLWDGRAVVVRVSDNGGGIPDNVVARIFEPFFTTKPVGKGTGLGLSVSYGIVTDMDGDILVKTGAAGATFEVRLPRYEAIREETRSTVAEAGV